MQVKEIIKKDVVKVKRSVSLKNLLILFKDFHTFPLVPVVDEKDILVGIVSLQNVIDAFQPHKAGPFRTIAFLERDEADMFDLEILSEVGSLILVDDFMERGYISVEEDSSLEHAYHLMKLHSLDFLPVIDRAGKLEGMIGVFDLILMLFRQKGVLTV
ncbi:MAG: CBS domain-containing protein [Candidatus Omnitrophica bacterium]|nr:CBS domain-containing protein [Candidatus Omnitrophota bacterium]